ncbi:MAG TPA: AtpZ/AtpI family protein [Devosiaceae bacterium]|jgi:ATP synthase protein I|nr:AtpZ/AtpI family protein [Devosiaceae bacterium]
MNVPRETKRPESAGKREPLTSDLAARIARAQAGGRVQNEGTQRGAAKDFTGMSRALRLGSEFIAAIVVGAGAGFLLDQWLGTGPWLMLVLLLIGFAAGVLNVTRSAAAMNRASPPPPGSDLGPGDDEDDEDR